MWQSGCERYLGPKYSLYGGQIIPEAPLRGNKKAYLLSKLIAYIPEGNGFICVFI
jgi:hypothetical protein